MTYDELTAGIPRDPGPLTNLLIRPVAAMRDIVGSSTSTGTLKEMRRKGRETA
jgi:hypothetical protein